MRVADFSLLPNSKTYGQLAWPFVTPYAIYVFISSIPASIVELWLQQVLKFILVSLVLLAFRRNYRFGQLKKLDIVYSILVTPVLLCIWVYPIQCLLIVFSGIDTPLAIGETRHAYVYSMFRFINSVFLVALFEEFFCRVYLMELLYQSANANQKFSLIDKIFVTIDRCPKPLNQLPLTTISVLGSTLIFTAGHDSLLFLSAFLYFLSTTILYRLTKSLWVCILTHTFSNFGVFILARFYGMGYLWA